MSKLHTAIVMAWRKGEDDVGPTQESAEQSIGGNATIYPVEDKTFAGPGRTRHRGIEAAKGADVVIIIDPHMRFDGDVLKRMARYVHKNGGIVCPRCYHNPECSFDHKHPRGASFYAGAYIAWRAKFITGEQNALCWKWNPAGTKPGPIGCVGGACYAFRRDWYYEAGQPLAALQGWGCDEEILSICAWMSGKGPRLFDGRVAHRWRAKGPWKLTDGEALAIKQSRMSLIHAVAHDEHDEQAMKEWQTSMLPNRISRDCVPSEESERVREALLAMKRTWKQWKAKVCGPDCIESKQPEAGPKARWGIASYPGPCKHPGEHKAHTYPNGNELWKCPLCGKNRIIMARAKP